MSNTELRELARRAGLAVRWHDYRGELREVAPPTLRAVLTALELPCATPAQIADSLRTLEHEAPHSPLPLAGAASRSGERAFRIDDIAPGRRLWGIAVQLYALRRPGDGGLGDFTALTEFVRAAASHGAQAVAISPVHAPFLADPARFSPYAPSSRLLLNPLHVDPDAAALALDLPEPPASVRPAEPQRLETLPLIDWPAAARARVTLLRRLFDRFAPAGESAIAREFRAFREAGGEALEDHARFEALHALQRARGAEEDWRCWPPGLRDPRDPAVAGFAREHAVEVEFHAFLQWLADRGLAAAQAAARKAGMAIGLITDLAVGTDQAGSHAWSRQADMLRGLSVGAPPDLLNTRGQDWGLTAFSPRALAQHGYAPFVEMLRAALRHAGGVRIDHVLGLNRLWLVPEGAPPDQGAYLRYPFEALLRVTAAESRRGRAIVVGEDLGTVPADLPPRLEAAGLMGLRVLWFMREHGLFVEPARWPAAVQATTTTHDLPTVAGWWQGRDLEWRARIGLFRSADEAAAERAARERDRRMLWDAFVHAGVAAGAPGSPQAAVDAAVSFIARTAARLAILPIEDIAGLDEQPNLPGTIDEHPNWRRRLPAPAAELLARPEAAARLVKMREERNL